MHRLFAQLRGFEIYRSFEKLNDGDGGILTNSYIVYSNFQNYRYYKRLFRREQSGTDGWDDGNGMSNSLDLNFELNA